MIGASADSYFLGLRLMVEEIIVVNLSLERNLLTRNHEGLLIRGKRKEGLRR